MSGDQFALWLSNRDLFHNLTDETLISRQQTIMSIFGGFRAMFDLCMKHHHNLDLLQHRKLFKSLSSITYQQNNDNQPVVKRNNKSLSLHHVHDICISVIFTFLELSDHFSLQKTCKSFTIIGRKKDSFRIMDHCYITFGAHLAAQHKLPHIIDHLKSKNEVRWKKAMDLLSSTQTLKSLQTLLHSGVIPLLFRTCFHCYSDSTRIQIVKYIDNIHQVLAARSNTNLLIKHGLFGFIKMLMKEHNLQIIDVVFHLIISLIRSDTASVITMNKHLNAFPFLINNMMNVMQFRDSMDDEVLHALIDLISSPSFQWKKASNHKAIRRMAKYLLLKWAQKLVNDEKEDEDGDEHLDNDFDSDQYITRIYGMFDKRDIVRLYYKADGFIFLDIFRKTALESEDIEDCLHHLCKNKQFMSFIEYELNNDSEFASYFLLNMLNNDKNGATAKYIVSHDRMLQKLIRCCYSSTNTIAMECCLALCHHCDKNKRVKDKLLCNGIVYAFQDFISYFQDQKKHLGLVCNVVQTLQLYAKSYSMVKCQISSGLKNLENADLEQIKQALS